MINTKKNFAVIQHSGVQHLVRPGSSYIFNNIKYSKKQQYIVFKKILFIKFLNTIKVGKPFLTCYQVLGVVVNFLKGDKTKILKTKPKKKYKRTFGYSSFFSRILICDFEELHR